MATLALPRIRMHDLRHTTPRAMLPDEPVVLVTYVGAMRLQDPVRVVERAQRAVGDR